MAMNFKYHQPAWGDIIYGSKAELQALGIAEGKAFPGEEGGPKRRLMVIDPRGFACKIERFNREGVFCASIPFPGRERPESSPETSLANGLRLRKFLWGDLYQGPATAFFEAKMIDPLQLPGATGGREKSVLIHPDGRIERGRASMGIAAAAGTKAIRLERGGEVSLSVSVDTAEEDRRYEQQQKAELNYLRRMLALPRPDPLVAKARQAEALARRSAIRLVWSKPPFVPTLTLPR